MITQLTIKSTNTILYCRKWQETVDFYRDTIGLSVNFEADWFVEFQLTETAHLSIADERRATIKSSHGAGITITIRVDDIDEVWDYLQAQGVEPEPIRTRWEARVFYFYDPEGHRLEVWTAKE